MTAPSETTPLSTNARPRSRKEDAFDGKTTCSPHLRSAFNQNIIVGLICLCCPGIFNALAGLGDAGGSNPSVASAMNAVLSGVFAIVGFFGGTVYNLLGAKPLLCFGGLSYAGYAFGVFAWGQWGVIWLAILMAGVLGIGAGLLWTAQGVITLAYATEEEKGTYVGVFWVIFNVGGCLGGLLTFALNFDEDDSTGGVNDATYFAFIAIMLVGALSSLVLIVPVDHVLRSDGTCAAEGAEEAPTPPTVCTELALAARVPTELFMTLLTPLIFASNWFYTYNFNGINAELFNPRTRGLNSALFWGSQMVAVAILGRLLDGKCGEGGGGGRRRRAVVGGALVMGFWLSQNGYALLVQYALYGTDCPSKRNPTCSGAPIDIGEGRWVAPGMLFVLMGGTDALVQCYCLWLIGSHANDPSAICRYSGYYKGVQSAGAGLAWMTDALGVDFGPQLLIGVGWSVICTPLTLYLATKVTEHTEARDSLCTDPYSLRVDMSTAPRSSTSVEH